MPYLESTKFIFFLMKSNSNHLRSHFVIPFIDILSVTGSIKLERISAKQNRCRSCMLKKNKGRDGQTNFKIDCICISCRFGEKNIIFSKSAKQSI